MELNISLDKLNLLITEAMNVGRADFLEIINPSSSTITRPRLLKYLKYRGYTPSDLKRWESLGILKYKQDGRNCSKHYKVSDVEACILKQMMVTK